MASKPKRCGNCRWWLAGETTATGRVRKQVPGKCRYEIVEPLMPMCVARPVYINKSAAWFDDDGTDCPCHERKEIDDAN